MAFTQYVPGMKPGSTKRNIGVGVVYVVLFPLMIFVLATGLAYHVAKNTNGLADGLTAIPGVSEGGGLVSGVVVGVGLFIVAFGLLGLIGGGGGGDDTPTDTQQAGTSGAAGDGDIQADAQQETPEENPDEASEQANVATQTSTDEPTPEPTATATPNPTPASDGESYEFSGSGQTATDRFSAQGGLLTIDLSHRGSRNFIVYLVDAETGDEELLVNTIGDFDGTVATNVPSGDYLIDVQADGSWEAGIEQPRYSQVEVSSLPADASGEDFAVLGPYQFEGVTQFTIDAQTDSNVIVYLLDHRGNQVQLLVNEIGPHEGSTTIRQQGVGLIYVEAEDSWTVTLEQA